MAAREDALVVSFGEMLIDFVPDEAGVSLAESKGFVKAAGGAPANVAVAVARLGGRSAFIGKVGDDEFGHMLVNILYENNVDIAGVMFDQTARTALAFVTLTRSGEREFMFYRNPSADMLLTEAELNLGLIRLAGVFHFGSISLISEPCRSAHIAAMAAARKAGAILTYDPNVRLPLWPSEDAARLGVLSVWNQADVIKVSDDEVAFLTEENPEDEDVILSLWFEGLKLLVVTAGAKGTRYFTKTCKGIIPGYPVKKVDATGAGDAFVGSLLNSIAKDRSLFEDEEKLVDALVFASACGAITCTKKGAIPALPTPSMVQKFLANPTAFYGEGLSKEKVALNGGELPKDKAEGITGMRRRVLHGANGNGSSTEDGVRTLSKFHANDLIKSKISHHPVFAFSIGFIFASVLYVLSKLYST